MDPKTLASIIQAQNVARLYRDESYDSTRNAQQNLSGRTHYVDADTLRLFKGKILKAMPCHEGLIFGIVESLSSGFDTSTRVYRPVFFDLFGTVMHHISLEDAFKTSQAAHKAFYVVRDSLNAIDITREAVANRATRAKREHDALREVINLSFGE